jgi:hypothetical protein
MVVPVEAPAASGEGAETRPMRTIDSLMAEGLAERLDFLKMDVEGGERAVLRGAIETIRRHRPKLAVAIYHEPRHLWEYPSFVLDHFEDYRLYVRQHGYSRFETLLYAAPAEGVEAASGRSLAGSSPEHRRRPAQSSPLMLAYLRDAPDHPRAFFARPVRPLTRAYGVDRETAELTPGPGVSAEHVDAVIETPEGRVILTRHRDEDGRLRVTVGLSRSPMELTWLHVCEAPQDAVCLAVDADDGALRYLIYSASLKSADLHEIRGGCVVEAASIPVARHPVAVRWRAGELEVLCRADEAGALLVVRPQSPGALPLRRKALPPGDLLGVAAIKRANGARSTYAAAIVMRDAGAPTASFHAETPTGFERAGELLWDDRFGLVSTHVSPCAGAAPSAGRQ